RVVRKHAQPLLASPDLLSHAGVGTAAVAEGEPHFDGVLLSLRQATWVDWIDRYVAAPRRHRQPLRVADKHQAFSVGHHLERNAFAEKNDRLAATFASPPRLDQPRQLPLSVERDRRRRAGDGDVWRVRQTCLDSPRTVCNVESIVDRGRPALTGDAVDGGE